MTSVESSGEADSKAPGTFGCGGLVGSGQFLSAGSLVRRDGVEDTSQN